MVEIFGQEKRWKIAIVEPVVVEWYYQGLNLHEKIDKYTHERIVLEVCIANDRGKCFRSTHRFDRS